MAGIPIDQNPDISLIGPDHVRKYQETNGEVGYFWNGVPTLLLTSKGKKTGEWRTIPIIFSRDGDKYVIIASMGGAPEHPKWYNNLLADPHARLQVKGDKLDVVARTADGPERERLWKNAASEWPRYDVYQTRTTRKIPVVVLEPVK